MQNEDITPWKLMFLGWELKRGTSFDHLHLFCRPSPSASNIESLRKRLFLQGRLAKRGIPDLKYHGQEHSIWGQEHSINIDVCVKHECTSADQC